MLQLIYFIHRRGCEFHPFVPFISQLNWPREGVENRKFQSRRSFYSFPASVNVSPIAFTKSFLFIWNTYFHNAPPFEITGKTGQGVRHKVLKVKYTYYQFIRSSPVKHITFLLIGQSLTTFYNVFLQLCLTPLSPPSELFHNSRKKKSE